MLSYASDAGHAPAHYEYGLALTEGRRGEDKIMQGSYLIAMACRDGNIDAIAWCGRAALYGLLEEPVNYARARELLERAAVEDHPMALTLLAGISPTCGRGAVPRMWRPLSTSGPGTSSIGAPAARRALTSRSMQWSGPCIRASPNTAMPWPTTAT